MSDVASDIALDYLSPPANGFWQWAEEARVICWRDGGQTIAFRSELETVLAALAPQGLPPLGAVLLFLAACLPTWAADGATALRRRAGVLGRRGLPPQPVPGAASPEWPQVPDVRGVVFAQPPLLPAPQADTPDWNTLIRMYGRHGLDATSANQMHDHPRPLELHLDRALEALSRVNALPADLRTGPQNKAELARILFEPVQVRLSQAASVEVLDAFRTGFPAEAVANPPATIEGAGQSSVYDVADTIMALYQAVCVVLVSEERLRLIRRTGLEVLPSPATVDLPVGQLVARLLRELKHDAELGGLANLASDLLAVVHLPRRVSDPEELPVGGLSDISHRGSLDRLLPGELAHDDLTLTVRIALNEALYYRREALLRNPVGRRRILLDTGIRMWGVPRVFAAAVALAMAATVPGQVKVEAFRASRDGVAPADLLTREGLVALLEALDCHAHPGRALARFMAEPAGTESFDDAILVTHEDVLADPAFQQELARAAVSDRPIYLVALDGEGSYRLWGCSGRGRRMIRQARLDLSAILGGEKARRAALGSVLDLIDRKHDPLLPVILSVHPFPLRMPHAVDWKKCVWREGVGLLSFSSDRRLTLWDKPGCGPRQVTDCLPAGSLYWMGMSSDGVLDVDDYPTACLLLRKGNTGAVNLVLVDMGGGMKCQEIEPVPFMRGAVLLGDRLCLVGSRKIRAVDVLTGQRSDELELPNGARWHHGRFFRHSGWLALSWDGGSLRLQELPTRSPHPGMELAAFDREGLDGPWVLFSTGELVCLADGVRMQMPEAIEGHVAFGEVSEDGHHILVRARNEQFWWHWNLRRNQINRHPGPEPWALMADVVPQVLAGLPALRYKIHKVEKIGVLPDGNLALASRRSPVVAIQMGLTGSDNTLGLYNRSKADVQQAAMFEPCNRPKGAGYILRVAAWSDGSRAWLDSRGLLHLKSSNVTIPEVSVVLVNQGPTAGWASDGTGFGRDYFYLNSPGVPAIEFYRQIQAFTKQLP